MEVISKHPWVAATLGWLIFTIPGTIEFWWALFSDEPFVKAMGRYVGMIPTDFPWLAVAFLPLGTVVFLYVLYATRRKQSREAVVVSRSTPRADNAVIFYQTRRELPDLFEYISGYEVVWALWQTATEADNHDIWMSKRIKKLVLIDPGCPYLGIQSAGTGRSVQELESVIKSATARAQKEGVEVKWFVGPIPSTLTIGNPETNPVIRVEPLMVYTNAHNRQSYQLDGRHPQALQEQLQQFDSIWKQSVAPYGL